MPDQPTTPALSLPQIAVPCPRCGAAAGSLCTSHGGRRVRRHDTHRDRRDAWTTPAPTTQKDDMTRQTWSPCRSCGRPRPASRYLCSSCWTLLPLAARRALTRRDEAAVARLRELHTQLDRQVPLAEIQISPL